MLDALVLKSTRVMSCATVLPVYLKGPYSASVELTGGRVRVLKYGQWLLRSGGGARGLTRWRCSPQHQWRNGGATIALSQGMANPTLAPEEDDPFSPSPLNFGPSAGRSVANEESCTEVQRVELHFDPQKVGFGIIDRWPRTVPPLASEGSAATSLVEGADRKEQK